MNKELSQSADLTPDTAATAMPEDDAMKVAAAEVAAAPLAEPASGPEESRSESTQPAAVATEAAELEAVGDAAIVAAADDDPQVMAAEASVAFESDLAEGEAHDMPADIDSLLARVQELAAAPDDTEVSADEVSRLKQQFYALHNEALRMARKEFVDAGNQAEAFEPQPDAREEEFKQALQSIKERRARLRAQAEAREIANLERKRAIIDELNGMSSDTDNVNRHHARVKELQAEFKALGKVPDTEATEVWKSYQEAVERFYDQWKVNKELRDYDFKKNLAEKQLVLDEAERLVAEPDPITAFRRTQALQEKWRTIGPVAKEIRDEIWNKFRDATAAVYKRYQAFFEERKATEQANEQAKTAICERLEALDFDSPSTYAQWDAMTAQVLEMQAQWKQIGFASRKSNATLFNRFRSRCDDFFARKAAFFKQMKGEMADNLARKTALCERAEALKDSTDWRKTTDEIVKLQAEWRTIGSVPRKQSDAVWRRFLAACDAFFDNKKKNASATRRTEHANLAAKRDIISELHKLEQPAEGVSREDAIARLHDLRKQWQATGHVPYRDKEKIQEEYRQLVGDLFDKLDIRESHARLEAFEADMNAAQADDRRLGRERDRLSRLLDQRRQELATYENNLGFLSLKSKGADTMLREMERRMQHLRDDMEEISKKIAIIDAKSNQSFC